MENWDWNDWIAEVSRLLLDRGVDNDLIHRKWSSVRHRFKIGLSPKEMVEHLCSTKQKESSNTA